MRGNPRRCETATRVLVARGSGRNLLYELHVRGKARQTSVNHILATKATETLAYVEVIVTTRSLYILSAMRSVRTFAFAPPDSSGRRTLLVLLFLSVPRLIVPLLVETPA